MAGVMAELAGLAPAPVGQGVSIARSRHPLHLRKRTAKRPGSSGLRLRSVSSWFPLLDVNNHELSRYGGRAICYSPLHQRGAADCLSEGVPR